MYGEENSIGMEKRNKMPDSQGDNEKFDFFAGDEDNVG